MKVMRRCVRCSTEISQPFNVLGLDVDRALRDLNTAFDQQERFLG